MPERLRLFQNPFPLGGLFRALIRESAALPTFLESAGSRLQEAFGRRRVVDAHAAVKFLPLRAEREMTRTLRPKDQRGKPMGVV